MSDTLRVELLGRLRVVRGGEVTTRFETRQTAALLAILALSLPRAYSRESLLEHLWPDEDPEATRPRLRQSLSVLRGILNAQGAPPALVTDREEVRLDPSRVTTDLAEFQAAVGAARRAAAPADKRAHLEAALRLAQDELLPGSTEDVILAARDRQAEARRGALVSLADLLREAGDHEAAIEAARQAVAADLCDEQAHLALIRAYGADGQTDKAIRQAHKMERVLREELDAAPSEATRAFVESLRAPAARPVAVAVLPPALPSGPPCEFPGDAPAPVQARRPWWTPLRVCAAGVLAALLLVALASLWPKKTPAHAEDAKAVQDAARLRDYRWSRRTKSSFSQEIKDDDAVLAKNPHDAAAYVDEAKNYAPMGYYAYLPPGEAARKTEEAARQAIQEAPGDAVTLAEAYTCLGWVAMVYRRDWKTAQGDFAEAKRLDPNCATAYQWDSLALMMQGRQQDSLAEIQVARRKDTFSFIIGTSAGGRSYYGRQYDQAIRQYTDVLKNNPEYLVAHFWRGLAYAAMPGQRQKAQADLSRAVSLSDDAPLFLAFQGLDYALNNKRPEALQILHELQRRSRKRSQDDYVDPFCLAVLDAGLGDRKTAFALFDRALSEDDGALILLEEAAPAFDFLDGDKRYADLRAQMHLPPRVSPAFTKISR